MTATERRQRAQKAAAKSAAVRSKNASANKKHSNNQKADGNGHTLHLRSTIGITEGKRETSTHEIRVSRQIFWKQNERNIIK